jgi:hypothetical protein
MRSVGLDLGARHIASCEVASGTVLRRGSLRRLSALGSARETGAYIDVAMACGYVEEVDAMQHQKLDRVRATLVKNVI